MNTLPNELIIEIFNTILKITDKRQFLKTCILYNNLTKISFANYEGNYKTKHFEKIDKYCVEKFTLELCNDAYFNLIPEHYVTLLNGILDKCAAYYGNIHLLNLVNKHGYNLCCVMEYGALGGQFDVIRWGLNNGIFDGHFGRDYNFMRERWICASAAQGGHLELLKWLYNEGCSWDYMTCAYAAYHGNLEILKYAYSNGCILGYVICGYAKDGGHKEILEWLLENGYPTE